jgi:two-component system response regulator AtoC
MLQTGQFERSITSPDICAYNCSGKYNYMKVSRFRIAVIEDDVWFSQTLKHRLEMNPEFEVTVFPDAGSFRKAYANNFNLVMTDIRLPDSTGTQLVDFVFSKNPDADVVVVSGQEDISLVLELLKKGIVEYIVKDDNILQRAWSVAADLAASDRTKQQKNKSTTQKELLIGECDSIKKVHALIKKAARSSITVVVTGETGTGKELVARSVHDQSERRDKPFVAVNVAAIPSELLESELFGHEKGAFTGAINKREGKFEEANGGTLFLDEIAELNLNLQAKLLRVLQEKEVTRIGGNNTVKLDVRIIIASHKNLSAEVDRKSFRQDLYYRLLGLPIELAPLRERKGDVELLANHFLSEFSRISKTGHCSFSETAIQKIKSHNYPGNVRELQAVTELAYTLAEGNKIITDREIVFEKKNLRIINEDADMTLEEYNRSIIVHYLRKYNHKVLVVAEKLGVGKSTIYNLLKNDSMRKAVYDVNEKQ